MAMEVVQFVSFQVVDGRSGHIYALDTMGRLWVRSIGVAWRQISSLAEVDDAD